MVLIKITFSVMPSFVKSKHGKNFIDCTDFVFGGIFFESFSSFETRGLIDFSLFEKLDQKIHLIEIDCIIFTVDDEVCL